MSTSNTNTLRNKYVYGICILLSIILTLVVSFLSLVGLGILLTYIFTIQYYNIWTGCYYNSTVLSNNFKSGEMHCINNDTHYDAMICSLRNDMTTWGGCFTVGFITVTFIIILIFICFIFFVLYIRYKKYKKDKKSESRFNTTQTNMKSESCQPEDIITIPTVLEPDIQTDNQIDIQTNNDTIISLDNTIVSSDLNKTKLNLSNNIPHIIVTKSVTIENYDDTIGVDGGSTSLDSK